MIITYLLVKRESQIGDGVGFAHQWKLRFTRELRQDTTNAIMGIMAIADVAAIDREITLSMLQQKAVEECAKIAAARKMSCVHCRSTLALFYCQLTLAPKKSGWGTCITHTSCARKPDYSKHE